MNEVKHHQDKSLIIYDAECTMCQRFKQALEHLDRHQILDFRPVQDLELFQEYRQIVESECHETVHLIDPQGNVYKGPEVVEFLIKSIPAVSKIAWLLDTNAGKKAVELFYHAVNEFRKSGSCSSCKRK